MRAAPEGLGKVLQGHRSTDLARGRGVVSLALHSHRHAAPPYGVRTYTYWRARYEYEMFFAGLGARGIFEKACVGPSAMRGSISSAEGRTSSPSYFCTVSRTLPIGMSEQGTCSCSDGRLCRTSRFEPYWAGTAADCACTGLGSSRLATSRASLIFS